MQSESVVWRHSAIYLQYMCQMHVKPFDLIVILWALWWCLLEQPAFEPMFLGYPLYFLYHTILTELPWYSIVFIELKSLSLYTQWGRIAKWNIDPSFLTVGNRRGSGILETWTVFAPGKEPPASTEWRAGWTLQPVWTLEQVSCPVGSGTTILQTSSL